MTATRDEPVIVVPTEALRALGPAPGFEVGDRRLTEVAFRPGVARPMPRSAAEGDPRFKQLVAYVILRHAGKVFHYQRTSRVGEQRLAGRRSLGLGGHLNAGDWQASGWEALETAIRRELAEEVELTEEPVIRHVGVIDDDAEPVSRVHLGIVAVADLARPAVRLRDPTLADGQFDEPAALRARGDELEGWSQLLLNRLWLESQE